MSVPFGCRPIAPPSSKLTYLSVGRAAEASAGGGMGVDAGQQGAQPVAVPAETLKELRVGVALNATKAHLSRQRVGMSGGEGVVGGVGKGEGCV